MRRSIIRFWLSSVILLLPLVPLMPCGDYYNSEQVRVTNFMDNVLHFDELTKYVFTTEYYKDDYYAPTYESYKENIEQWFTYCNNKNVKRKDIYDFLYVLSDEDFIKKEQVVLEKNTFLVALKKKPEALKYVLSIKRTSGGSFEKTWDDFGNEYGLYYEGRANIYDVEKLDSLHAHTTDAFLKRRYAYQSLIADFYYHPDSVPTHVVNIFDLNFKYGKKDWMYYSALHYVAYFMPDENEIRLDCIINGSDKQARNIELLYASPDFKHFLATEKDPIKKSYLLAVRAMRNMGPCLSDLKEIYRLNPKNIYFNFLLNREVNKIEDWILTPKFTSFPSYVGFNPDYESHAARNYKKDLLYTNDVLEFTSQLQGTNNAMFVTLINSYLNYILHRPEKAFEILNSTAYLKDKTLALQARTIALLIKLSEKNVDVKLENELCELITLSPTYTFRNQLIRSCAALLFKIPAYRAKAFLLLSQSFYPKEYFGNDLYYNLNDDASIDEIYQMIAIINKPKKSALETFIATCNTKTYSWEKVISEERIAYDTLKMKNLIAMKHIRVDQLDQALAVYNTFPQSYWEDSYFDDPFTFSIFDEHNHAKTDKIGYTKKQFLEKLIAYKRELAVKPNDPLLNYYVGNAYLSLTWYGKNWYMSNIGWSSYEFKFVKRAGTQFEKNYFKFSRALPYIKKAAANGSDKKLQTLAKLNLAYCYSHIKNEEIEDLLDIYTRDYYTEIKLNCDVYEQYLNHYRLVDDTYSPAVSLSRFKYFDEGGSWY